MKWCMASVLAATLLAGAARAEPGRYYLFHGTAVTPETARADLDMCIGQASLVVPPRGHAAAASAMRAAVMRKCMGLLGYDRHAVAREQWEQVTAGGDMVFAPTGSVDSRVTQSLADFAAGPLPAGARLPR